MATLRYKYQALSERLSEKYRIRYHNLETRVATSPDGVKASDLSIKALKPRAISYEVAVREHRGLIVRVHPSGDRTFIYRYRQDGVLKRVSLTANSLSAARVEWEGHRAAKKAGADPAEAARNARAAKQLRRQADRSAPTINELARDFVELYSKPRKRSWSEDERMLRVYVCPSWGTLKAKDITRRDVIDLVDQIAQPRSSSGSRNRGAPVAANRVLAVVRKMFNWAVGRDTLAASPCIGVKPPGHERRRDRVLTDDEIHAFWNGLPDSGLTSTEQAALKLQLLTATRIGEVVGSARSEFDLKRRQWLIPGRRSKNGRDSLVFLSAPSVELINSLPGNSEWMFPGQRKTAPMRIDRVTSRLSETVDALGMAHFTSHDLRRTAATKLAQLGVSRTVIDAILNHTDRSVGAIYDRHSYSDEKRNALNAWANLLVSIVSMRRKRSARTAR